MVSCQSVNDVPDRVEALVQRFRKVHAESMLGLPICNPKLDVTAVGFSRLGEHQIGVLLTPWFMNLMLLPGDDSWAQAADGDLDSIPLPAESCEFTICQDECLGTYLSAVLFRTVADFPNQQTAVAVARETLRRFLEPPPPKQPPDKGRISRRSLLRGLGTS